MPNGTVTAIALNLRQQPTLTADVIAVLTKDSIVDEITTSDDESWCLVSSDVDGRRARIGNPAS